MIRIANVGEISKHVEKGPHLAKINREVVFAVLGKIFPQIFLNRIGFIGIEGSAHGL
jgi:hypothetical protein